MRHGIIYSSVLHAIVLALAVFGVPLFDRNPLPSDEAIVVEIVTIADETRTPEPPVRAQPKPETKSEPPKPEPAKEEPAPKPPEPPQQAARIPEPEPEPVPPPEPKAKPKPKPEVKPKTAPKPRVNVRPQPKPRRERQQDEMLAALRSVEEMERSAPRAEAPPEPEKKKRPVARIGDKLTISEMDALRQQLYRCWNVPLGARDIGSMVVQMRVTVRPDRTVLRADILDRSRVLRDPHFRAMAESAYRAVVNPRCSPLRLPTGKYELWKTLTLIFDPREMVR